MKERWIKVLNKNLDLNKCMELLNNMAEGTEDADGCNGEIIYILVNSNKMEYLKQLIPDEKDLKTYLDTFSEDWQEEGCFDISEVFGAVCDKFNANIFFNGKEKKFYLE